MTTERDPGDAVPPGVAPLEPAPLTAQDDQVRTQLDQLGHPEVGETAEQSPDEIDEEVERMSRTVQPHSAAPPRSGISGSGSGADGEGL